LRAVVLEARETLRIDERPPPESGPGEVLVDVAWTGICGTDVSIYTGKIPVRHPLVMGHEIFGRIASPGGAPFASDTRVVVDPVLSCGVCFWCAKGQSNLCPSGALLGRDRDGGCRDRMAVPSANVHPVPDTIEDSVAALIQVLTVCLHGQRDAPVYPGDSALVIGLGVSGLLHLQVAKARGARPLIGVTRSASKRALAEELGADVTLDPADPLLDDKVRAATEGRGPDVAIECAGYVETFARAIELVRPGGRMVGFGTITATSGSLPFYLLYLKEIALTNPRAAKPEDFPVAIGLAADGAVRLEPLISHFFPLEAAQEAITTAQRTGTMKVMLDHGGDRS
jgi:2-desacetyl-2-hydroxyethyl bacteriochlorophyllide A dehydrogenase